MERAIRPSEWREIARNTRKGMKAADAHLRKYGKKKSEARSARLIKKTISMWGIPEKQIVKHLSWVIQNNPGVETNLLHSHLAFLMTNHGGEYSFSGGTMTKVPTNKQIIAMLDDSGLFASKNVEHPQGFYSKRPRHWWFKRRDGSAIELRFVA